MISFSVNRELARQRRANREEQRANDEEQMEEMAELGRLLPQLRGLVENQTPRPQTPATPGISTLLKQLK
jgi:hypothetical protein